MGTLVAVPAFFLLWRVYGLGPDSETLPAPAGISWSNFARVLSEGWKALPPYAPTAVLLADDQTGGQDEAVALHEAGGDLAEERAQQGAKTDGQRVHARIDEGDAQAEGRGQAGLDAARG